MTESQHTEWKESWRDDYIKWLCGFANAEGGVLIVGRDDKGKDIGIGNARELLEVIPNKVRDLLGIIVDVNLVESGNKTLIEIIVEPYPYPISYKGQYHYRTGSTKQELKGAALDQFLLKKQGKHWDAVPVPGFTEKQCSQNALDLFKTRAARSGRVDEHVLNDDLPALLENLQLTEGAYLKRATALLFADKPEKYVSGAYIKIGYFVTDDDLRYQDEIHGHLFAQVEQTIETLKRKYLKAYISYEGLQRVETYLFPFDALREALLNAVVHKDYSSGIPIQISVYDHQIVIWNPGCLPDNWTIERLLGKHPSAPFNPLLANTFFRSGYIESWGRGIEKIQQACQQHNIPKPVFDFGMAGLMLTFQANPKHMQAALVESGLGEGISKGSPKSSPKSSPKTEEQILELIRANSTITTEQLGDEIGISKRAVLKQISKLKELKRLERIGAAKGGHWQVIEDDK